jgi:hypothetical protein
MIYYLRVFDAQTDELLGNLVDISTRGIMIVSDKPLPTSKHYRLKMLLPDTVAGSRSVEIEAESRWCKNDVNPDFFDTGFELITATPDFVTVVEQLISDCMFKE